MGSISQWEQLNVELTSALGSSVHFDTAHQAVYASEASNYRQIPIGVVTPKNTEEFVKGIEICHRNKAPVLMRGAGTSMNGQTVNNAVVFDISKYCNHILALDPVGGNATVEPGVICDSLRDAAELHGLTFAPDPSTHSRCTLGGMVANNSCGAHFVMAGKTLENTEALEILTYDGERFWVGPTSDQELQDIIAAGGRKGQIYQDLLNLRDRYADLIRARFPNIKRRVSGYNLDQLLPENGFNVARALVGTEGTCALTLAAKVRLVNSPSKRVVLVLGFEDIKELKDALDTCLSCKSCKSDCPAHVDMASYKAEFLSHYHETNTRPRQALTMGRIGDWAPLASKFSWLVNGVMQTPVLSSLAKWVGGVAQERNLPKFANQSFRKQFQQSKGASVGHKKVILWVDTFCEHFHPEVANAAVEVLIHAGFEATLPKTPLCCGRPLYDFGYLDLAKQKLEKILDAIGNEINSDPNSPVAVVGLEQGYTPPPLDRNILVHSHCHQKSLFGTKGDVVLLTALGAKADYIDSGCCGMAGSFGFNPEHVEISKAVGELVLLPAIRSADQETIILTNGFSCREQIEQETGRKVKHLAELLQMAHQAQAQVKAEKV
ncbi:FAD-binding and (Fe-S)-binding domain-containing protein [Polynucleobacter necessarius]|uniref:FAD-binding and (Fe-S)-binding domain-containing protein n=1 Tax=Polynucleobacter necessarius TaxID=576610 RepID=UPI000E09811B|nr:FAD-binding oxidoreductase [Polynucleobacter necessarius]